jgi:hypothetical protein
MNLCLTSRRLPSGRFQINFLAKPSGPSRNLKDRTSRLNQGYGGQAGTNVFDQPCYGYLLVDKESLVSDVIEKIRRHVLAMQDRGNYFQRNLLSLKSRNIHSGRTLLFAK